MITTVEALQSLKPGAEWVLRGDELEWLDTEQAEPTDIEIQTELARLTYLDGVLQYQKDREYPAIGEQLDNIFHNGLDAWKADIQLVKDAVLKVEPIEADQQAYIDEHVATYVFNKQLGEYTVAVARLAEYILADGREEVTEMKDTLEVVVDDEGMPVLNDDEVTYVQEEVVVVSAVDPLDATVEITVFNFDDFEAEPSINTIENPEITQDNLERTEAQGVVDTTPLEVIDHYTEN
jgi:hypothetical protein